MPMLDQAAAQAAPPGAPQGAPQGAPPPGGAPPGGAPQGAPPPGGAPPGGGAPPPGGGAPPPEQPVPPVDPEVGKVDVTTAAGQADPRNASQASGTAGAIGQARVMANRKPGLMEKEQDATPEEQEAYEEALDAIHRVLYEDPERSEAIVGMLDPRDKIGSIVKTGITLIKRIDEKIDLDENVVAEITVDLSDRLIELAETSHEMEFSERETQAIAGATWEGVLDMFGFDPASVEEMTQGMSEEDLTAYEDQYKGFVAGKM